MLQGSYREGEGKASREHLVSREREGEVQISAAPRIHARPMTHDSSVGRVKKLTKPFHPPSMLAGSVTKPFYAQLQKSQGHM